MKRTESPKKQPIPFAVGGLREDLLPTTPAGDNTASYNNGFPPITMVQKNAGGLPPKGQDMNQILYELSSLSRWASSGAINSFDSDFSSKTGGYPKGSQLIGDDGATIYISTIDDNTSNPNSGGGGWFNQTNGYFKTTNNLSEIAASGGAAQLQARESIGLTGMGIGVAPLQALPSLDWQQFDFVAGANYASLFSSWVNQPAGVTYPSGSFISITVDYLLNGGDFGVTVLPNTSSNPNYMVYKIRGSGGKGARTFNVRQVFTSADTIPLSSGGLGATTAAGGRATLGLGTAALASVGNGSGQIPDMSYFTTGPGWIKYPNGKIIQYGYQQASISSAVVANFPVPFPSQCFGITSSGTDSSAANIAACQIIDRFGFYASAWLTTSGAVNRTNTNISWIAVGV